ncbi:septation protein SepH [Microbacterium dauci]|uniref:Septation protein SepH n=1 Tax=Microbacterium dauci TaxID=3048008 RepID=A0ABT6ZGZ2_9MICO|nr:septation protein SepH [Microbacterium sp. LX3-4]MDJ1115421.1 septation protein SepH [Microbacterium sp. LX3-4]
MEQLKVIGTEDGRLMLATDAGDRFSLAVDESLRAQLRRLQRETEPRAVRPSPRDIQAHIRSGMSAEEVAELLGVRLEDVQRFEGPVLAEREHIVGQALAVTVLIGGELDPGAQPTFGNAVRAKLTEANATGERWTSWRDQSGWVVKLEFTANEVDHDARWSFDPRRSSLSPQNSDAVQLSRQGSLPEGLIPRLRALDSSPLKDATRFDSAAFGPRGVVEVDVDDTPEARPSSSPAVQQAAIKRAPDAPVTSAETADLLEALRRRRGQREPMPSESTAPERASSPVALFDALEPGYDEADAAVEDVTDDADAPTEQTRRKGRTSMPSWDEIVFGARTEDG